MEARDEIRQFLTTRRAKLTPQEAGLPASSGNRRVDGLRRNEVAMLAGVSVEYYARMERGNLSGVSEIVLDAVARALHMDEAEHQHLHDLARTANRPARAPRRRPAQGVRPGVRRMLETITDGAAFIRNSRLDLLATNPLARALYSPVFDNPANRANVARFRFLDPNAAAFCPTGDKSASIMVNLLRTEAGQNPRDAELTELIGELRARSPEFRRRWAAHDVHLHYTGTTLFHHPVVGDLALAYEAMPLPADPGLTLTTYSAEPGTPAHNGLKLLADWAATRATGGA